MSVLKWFGTVVGAIVGFFIIVIVIACIGIFGFGWFQRSTANFRGETAAIEKTKANADFRLNSYNTFFDLCGQVQAQEGRIKILQDQIDAGNAPVEAQTNLSAVQSIRVSLITEYNAKASRGFTEGQFRDSNLPVRLNINNEETVCKL